MIMNTEIIRFPAMCFPLYLENHDKRINILLGKGLQRLGLGMLLGEKSKEVT